MSCIQFAFSCEIRIDGKPGVDGNSQSILSLPLHKKSRFVALSSHVIHKLGSQISHNDGRNSFFSLGLHGTFWLSPTFLKQITPGLHHWSIFYRFCSFFHWNWREFPILKTLPLHLLKHFALFPAWIEYYDIAGSNIQAEVSPLQWPAVWWERDSM